ncbi:hypothetical protein GW17_00043114 [Ensete ventricosum]|nr:hypothetical protein GW17_00043114 [Ensete ventricosum]
MKVDFPRWEEGDSIGWISRAERYFRFYRTADSTRVEITAIHLEGNAIQYFYRGPNAGDPRRSKGAATVHFYGGDFLRAYPGRTIEPQGMKDKVAPQPAMLTPTAPSTAIQAPTQKMLTRDELHERLTKELCWHCDEPWSREHHCKKGRLLVIELAEDEDNETSEEALEPKEEAMEEESQPANYAVHALAGYSNLQMMKVGGLLKQ